MESIDNCIAWLERLDRITWDYLKNHVNFFEELVAWTWDPYSQCIEIHYTGDAWESAYLCVSLKDLLEWGDEHVKENK